jgi:hypothetical protein
VDWRQCNQWLIEKIDPMRKNQKGRRKGGRIRTLTRCGPATAATMEQISSATAIPSGGEAREDKGDDQGSRRRQLRVWERDGLRMNFKTSGSTVHIPITVGDTDFMFSVSPSSTTVS